ncbi:hypothetical protein AAur_pTC10123 (plasmid) [Paenarthrobacter aurescens TC1]|uniref:Uncharacterized protein n=1 Tax=Paenarthrobacter aurescens (strain TC1) TaxID=290340 RepID=A1RCN3_PAEAT|nr:hypothetical protein AAur_pTC10123 [Paenarthrobacter aurescens TC1]
MMTLCQNRASSRDTIMPGSPSPPATFQPVGREEEAHRKQQSGQRLEQALAEPGPDTAEKGYNAGGLAQEDRHSPAGGYRVRQREDHPPAQGDSCEDCEEDQDEHHALLEFVRPLLPGRAPGRPALVDVSAASLPMCACMCLVLMAA